MLLHNSRLSLMVPATFKCTSFKFSPWHLWVEEPVTLAQLKPVSRKHVWVERFHCKANSNLIHKVSSAFQRSWAVKKHAAVVCNLGLRKRMPSAYWLYKFASVANSVWKPLRNADINKCILKQVSKKSADVHITGLLLTFWFTVWHNSGGSSIKWLDAFEMQICSIFTDSNRIADILKL